MNGCPLGRQFDDDVIIKKIAVNLDYVNTCIVSVITIIGMQTASDDFIGQMKNNDGNNETNFHRYSLMGHLFVMSDNNMFFICRAPAPSSVPQWKQGVGDKGKGRKVSNLAESDKAAEPLPTHLRQTLQPKSISDADKVQVRHAFICQMFSFQIYI